MSKYGALHIPTLQETSSWSYGHHNLKGKFRWNIYGFLLEDLILTTSIGLSHDHDVISIYVYFFLTWDVYHITYYMFCMQLVWFHQGPQIHFIPKYLTYSHTLCSYFIYYDSEEDLVSHFTFHYVENVSLWLIYRFLSPLNIF